MEYRVISFGSGWIRAFEEDVNKAIQEGWRPLGGISVVKLEGRPFADLGELPEYGLYQAMTREIDDGGR